MTEYKRNWVTGILARLLLLSTYSVTLIAIEYVAVAVESFPIPHADDVAIWEAERARFNGAWRKVRCKWASGGSYVMPRKMASKRTLEFPFETDRPMTLSVRPIWFAHGERLIAKRFPHPLRTSHGPDAIDWCDDYVFFTCPSAGNIGIINVHTEKLVGAIQTDGYPIDLLADRRRGVVYVADAKRDCIFVITARRHPKLVRKIDVPERPWSLALHGGKLFVACMDAKRIIVIDSVRNAIIAQMKLPLKPVHVSIVARPQPRIVVWFMPLMLNVNTLTAIPSNVTYVSSRRRRWCKFGYPQVQPMAIVDSPKLHTLRINIPHVEGLPPSWRGVKRLGIRTIDVRSVTEPSPERLEMLKELELPIVIGPDAIDGYPTYVDRQSTEVTANTTPMIWHDKHFVFFTAPAAGKVGVVDLDREQLMRAIDVGGYPADLLADQKRGEFYIADALKRCVVVFNAIQQTRIAEIKMRGVPRSLELCAGKLFVACAEPNSLSIIDPNRKVVIRRLKLPLEPVGVSVRHEPLADGQVMRVRYIAVKFPAFLYDVRTLRRTSGDAPESFARRSSVQVNLPDGSKKTFHADNLLTIRVDNERWIDVTSVADPQLKPMQPLSNGDIRGTITLAIDDGPEYDWRGDIWFTPNQQIFLIYDTDEFWSWNAVTFHVRPGRHVLRVRPYSRWACLDALYVTASLNGRIKLNVTPRPSNNHWVFYDDEPVEFDVAVVNRENVNHSLQLSYTISNYMGEPVERGSTKLAVEPYGIWRGRFIFNLTDTGRFTLTIKLQSDDGQLKRWYRFVRLPKLVRPRLLFRKDDIDRIRERIARYPRLFDRYLSWLQRQVERPNFLPQGITRERVGGRTYELGWRVVACLFASLFLNDDGTLARSIKPIIDQLKQGPPFDLYNEMFHFNMPFFPGAMAVLLDLATLRDEGALEAIRKFYTPHIGEVWVLYNGLCALEEPLTERERAIVFMTAMWMTNVERYFDAHCGKRGGNWWVSPWTGCQCPLSGFWHAFLYLRNFLGEERVLEKKCFREFLTHHRYVASRWCKVGCLAIRGPVGEPARWLAGVMSHNALEMKIFGWREFVEKLNGELPQPEAKAVDELFRKRSAIVIPLALALGWYDPSMPEVDWTALPTTMLFDGEGEVAMRSGWDERSNFIYFTCGVRDVVYRNHPNHFHILKGGDMLIGTLSLWGDHVLAVPSWGNVVVVDDEWAHRWRLNVGSIFPRASEFPIINRYTLPYRLYRIRDKRLYGFSEMGIGGSPTIGWSPLNFHQHQDDLFMREGNIVAYETTPAFDYVAGDATNAWELEKVQYAYRQIIFIKPDVVVIYDRMRLGRTARCTRWLAAVPTRVVVNETTFTIKNGESALWGMILMPKRAIVKIIDPAQSEVYRYLYCRVVEQRVLEITPPKRARRAEYLVVMRISDGIPKPLDCKLSVTRKMVNVAFAVDGKDVAIAFARSGIPGGFIRIVTDSQRIERPLTENINDG